MDFLLECIGFAPDFDLAELVQRIRYGGEPVAWRGPRGTHMRFAFQGGLEVRLDREDGQDHWTLWPHYEVQRRLRVSVQSVVRLPDSPYDALLTGIANPPPPGLEGPLDGHGDDYPLATYVSDARRLERPVEAGHVVAVSAAGFALDVSYVGPNAGVKNPYILEEPSGASLLPVGGPDRPGGCMEVSLRVKQVLRLRNPITGIDVDLIEADAPGRPLDLFLSRWQLEADGFDLPRPGWRVEGAFLFTGRVTGGVPMPAARDRTRFG